MHNPIPQLETVSAKDLLARPVEPLGYTIESVLPHGLFILAGSAKVGKSWLALVMSRCVASGDIFLNYPASQGDVLYLALEDSDKRLQRRLNKVSSMRDFDSPTDMHFVAEANRLGRGLSEQISEFLDAHPHTRLIVIDTLQYIRNNGSYAGTYSGDYHDMDELLDLLLDEAPVWKGTATQLRTALALLDPIFSISPIGLAKMLKARQEFMRVQHGIDCRFTRNKSARLIELSSDIIIVDCETINNDSLRLAV